jgi:hypothetical protein
MLRNRSLTRTILAALLIGAVAAPAASAGSIDLRPPDPRNAAPHVFPQPADGTSGTAAALAQERYSGSYDERSARAGALAQERYHGSYEPPAPQPSPTAGGSDVEEPWFIVAIALAGTGLAAAGIAGRTRRTRVTT